MFNSKLKSVLASLVFLGLLLGAVDSASAQSAALSLPVTHVSEIAAQGGDLVNFSQFVAEDIYLNGPFDSENIYFSLPANWRLTKESQLNLFMTVMFNQDVQNSTRAIQGSAGSITITLNDVLIGVAQIESAGELNVQFLIPPKAFATLDEDGLYQLRFFLESGWTCQFDENMLIVLHTTSSMTLPHETVKPDTNLINFPSPIYQKGSIFTDPALVVLPDHPTAAELQSAMTIAAGLSNLSSSKLLVDINTVSHLTAEQIKGNNLILIGGAVVQLNSDQLILPLPASGGKFSNPGGNTDDGIVQMINSPWSDEKVILIVSGNTDAANIKSAQAVSTGSLRSNIYPNVAIVDTVKTVPIPKSPPVDQTLTDMGKGGSLLKDVGINYAGYEFYIPSGQTITEDAYFELHFGHSSLLQYDRSGIVVNVNGKPIGSMSLTEETARQSVNTFRVSIPPSAVFSGSNYLEVKINLIPVDRCSSPDLDGVYANIWPESNLHLPLVRAVNSPIANYDLITYPVPFVYDATLNSTAFVLQKDDINGWREAFHIAGYLADFTNGPIATLSAFYADELPEVERSKYNLIMIGRPSQLPILGEINKSLPAPFDLGQDIALEPEMQVKYRINPKASVGYVELLPSPWNGDNVILMAVGNDVQSVSWAASHLVEPLSWKLAGNFAVINDKRVYTADTRMVAITPGINSPQIPVVEVVPPAIGNPGDSTPYRPAWILPALAVSVVMILLTVIAVVYFTWFRNRSRASKTAHHEPKNK